MQKTEPDKVWNFFTVHAPKQVRAFFSAAIISEVGNGKNTCFWTDRWLQVQMKQSMAGRINRLIMKEPRLKYI